MGDRLRIVGPQRKIVAPHRIFVGTAPEPLGRLGPCILLCGRIPAEEIARPFAGLTQDAENAKEDGDVDFRLCGE